MLNPYSALKEQFQRIARLDHALTFLQWDQLVMMPPGGNDTRSKSIAELTMMRHELLCSEVLGDLLQQAQEQENSDRTQSRSLLEMERSRRRAVSVPGDLVKAKSLAGSLCEHGWRKQRKQNDWTGFLTTFTEVVNLSRQEAKARQAAAPDKFPTPYDALLDLYCTGDDSAFIQDIFTLLKKELPEILAQVDKQANEKKVELLGSFPVEQQKELNRKLMELLGFDFQQGRLDVSLHPFSTGDRGDQRITTRFRETDFFQALLATAHETGHAGYQNGLPAEWDGLPIGCSRNMSIHESQSLLFEKQLFLSKPFLSFFTPFIHQFLPQTGKWSSDQILSSATIVRPSLIRVEADEVTYPLHIILRFEIEKELINGTIEAADIPDLWDAKMQEYLGLSTKGNYREGCLQDIHWTDGSFGYFPSYTVGALNAAQLFAAITRKFPDWSDRLKQGDVSFLRQWLDKMIWSKGSSLESQEIMEEATGEGTNAAYLLSHLRSRFLEDRQ
ncbi:carboxypeptidase M32 [Desulfopila inferna]|uniref:carboxypeptidase M32 n=1 Tax=Desulfopila inferna TaxID=468528 RepID=UPI0019629AE7|nr:carboxypeptidase M32 [Desulfopila inferna]MBM9606189.1 carboxypeptidase M32 [Desulfopila inferna]